MAASRRRRPEPGAQVVVMLPVLAASWLATASLTPAARSAVHPLVAAGGGGKAGGAVRAGCAECAGCEGQ